MADVEWTLNDQSGSISDDNRNNLDCFEGERNTLNNLVPTWNWWKWAEILYFAKKLYLRLLSC